MTSHLIDSRQGRPGNDPIFALSKLAAERKAAGGDVINATLGVLLPTTQASSRFWRRRRARFVMFRPTCSRRTRPSPGRRIFWTR